MESLHGIVTAMATPFVEGGRTVDEETLRRLLDRTIDDGVHGIVACASTGEFATMTVAERHQVVAITLEHVAGRVPVVVNTGAMSTAEAVELSRDAERRGAAAVMPVAPYYDPLRANETFEYHAAIGSSIDIPIVAYNHPEATGVDLPPEFIARLGREIPNVRYVKNSSGSFLHLTQLLTRYSDDIQVLTGIDAFVLPGLELGAVGCIVGAGTFLGAPLVSMFTAWTDGRYEDALGEWRSMLPTLELILEPTNFSYQAAVKAACRLTGLDIGAPRLPLRELGPEDESALLEALRLVPAVEERLSVAAPR
ncbi:MAG TPA: dihydrodipicolinate synthase family protein [Solirubrobacteraceae bacterium]|nr:dihydrodipicolinate synthase family protein [Solirubrobacteraceae bacterium]